MRAEDKKENLTAMNTALENSIPSPSLPEQVISTFFLVVWLAFFGCPIYSYSETLSTSTEANGSYPLYVLITKYLGKLKLYTGKFVSPKFASIFDLLFYFKNRRDTSHLPNRLAHCLCEAPKYCSHK